MRVVLNQSARLVVAALAAALLAASPAAAVVGGTPAERSDFPAVIMLARACTATLIEPDRLLTAGHCAGYVDPGRTVVRIGDPHVHYVATRVARHPHFRYQLPEYPAEPFHDVAIVELDRPVRDVAPMVVSGQVVRAGARVEVVGYGTGDPERPGRYGRLRRAELIVRSAGVCRKTLERVLEGQGAQFHSAEMLCTQDPDGRPPYASGCNGDSGGPLLLKTARGRVIVGVDSWGIACGAKDGDPEVFARTSRERAFVMATDPAWEDQRIREPWDMPAARAAGTRTLGRRTVALRDDAA